MTTMDFREKMVRILNGVLSVEDVTSSEQVADHLIANGVTVQEWISVNDRLPETILCDAGTAYSEAVNVLTTGRKVLTAIWDGTDFIADAEFWEAEDEEITHWTPVLLPLPPKCTGRRCPMQVGYKVDECDYKDCPYRTE